MSYKKRSKSYKLQNINPDAPKQNTELSSPYYTRGQLRIIYYTQLLLGVGCVIAAIYFYGLQCNFYCLQTKQEFVAICAYVFLYPLGFMLILDSISKIAASNSISMVAKYITLTLMGLISILIPIYLFLPQNWNGSQYFKLYQMPPISNYLNTYTLSFQLFVLWVPMGTLFLLMTHRLFRNNKNKKRKSKNKNMSKGLSSKQIQHLSLCYVSKYI